VPKVTVVFEATGMPRLNAQSPSELRWRLRVESRHIYRFDNNDGFKAHHFGLMDPAAAGPLPGALRAFGVLAVILELLVLLELL
jgi:hypothetical protein